MIMITIDSQILKALICKALKKIPLKIVFPAIYLVKS